MVRKYIGHTKVVLFFWVVVSWVLSSFSSAWKEYKEEILSNQSDIAGWCDIEKAELLMDFVYETKPKLCVEIGVFAGATTYPFASALRFIEKGTLYAIDAWDNTVAIKGLSSRDPNLNWWRNLDLDSIRDQFLSMVTSTGLNPWVQCLHMRSDQAVSFFEDGSIDLLYIDGNFSIGGSFQDIQLYFPKVKKGGYIWLNDADFDTKIKSVSFLMNNSIWMKKKSLKNRCIVFKKVKTH